jgi:UDP-glucuronate decarboxylase
MMHTRIDVTGPVNIGNPVEFSILELATQVIDMVGSQSRIIYRPLPENDPKQRRPDISLAQDLLDRKPHIGLMDGLTRTIAYFDRLLSNQELRAQLTREPSV